MLSISSYTPSFRATNDIRHEVKQSQKTATSTNSENKIGVKDIVLGSLATIGVLGMADVMLFKGKGINKLTGVAKKLKSTEELEQRAKNAEELIAKAEERAECWKNDYNKLKEERPKLPLHVNSDMIDWLQTAYSDALDFSKAEKDYLTKRIKTVLNAHNYDLKDSGKINVFEREVSSDIKTPILCSPTIIHRKTGKVVATGKIYMPKSMIDMPNEDIRLLANGNCLFRQKTENGSVVKLIDTEGNILKKIRFPKKESVK